MAESPEALAGPHACERVVAVPGVLEKPMDEASLKAESQREP